LDSSPASAPFTCFLHLPIASGLALEYHSVREGKAVLHIASMNTKNSDNVRSGERSQEITFDFVSTEAGFWRHAETIPGHRYQIEGWCKHVRSASPVELSLGVDLSGGENWQASSVEWYPWDETGEDVWVVTHVTVRATGETLTVFLNGYHPFAVQGGATLFDDVRVVEMWSQAHPR
jgi:hypothetical protein